MAGELRWILLGLSVVLLLGIVWWGARRSRQSPGNAQLRESGTPVYNPPDQPPMAADPHRWGVSPLEPLSIRTADFDPVSMADMSMTATRDRVAIQAPLAPAPAATPTISVSAPIAEPPTMATPPAGGADSPNASEAQLIVTIRVSAAVDSKWGGAELMAALEKHGFGYGRYKVFHRKHVDGRTLLCAASLVEPGTFDVLKMPEQEFRGVTLFAVLPGPIDAVETIDLLLLAGDALAQSLGGVVQDSKGAPLTAERVIGMREDVVRFRASLMP